MNAVLISADPVLERDLQKIHVDLMRHPMTCLFSGVILYGESCIVYDGSIPTACTDGKNKYYGAEFIRPLNIQQRRGLVMHENLHIVFMHLLVNVDLRKEDARMYNVACDYVINGMIMDMPRTFIDLPEGGMHDPKFKGWSARQVYDFLKKQCKPNEPDKGNGSSGVTDGDGNNYPTNEMDEHDYSGADAMDAEETKKQGTEIREALQQGAVLAGVRGSTVPRAVEELLTPSVDWRDEMRDVMSEACAGRDELTWRSYNRRTLGDDDYRPGVESETVGEVTFCIDTSGSISNADIALVAGELSKLCVEVQPSQVRVVWWDTQVHGVQMFTPEAYDSIATLLKPMGGGGTRVGCVNEYIRDNNIHSDIVVVMTDGYVESSFEWQVSCPTLWVLSSGCNRSFAPPKGRVVNIK